MTFFSLFAAAYAFTATATGVAKGTPLEFMFAGRESDRDYETMFLIDGSVDDFRKSLEKAGIPRGTPTDYPTCRLWPCGVSLDISPPLEDFVESDMPDGISLGDVIYTGGTSDEKGNAEASLTMPMAVFSFYTLPQSLLVFNGIYDQGAVYGSHKAKIELKKGERRKFTLTWDEKRSPRRLDVCFKPGNAKAELEQIRLASEKDELDVHVSFDGELTVSEATLVARALSVVDSVRVKINGRNDGDLFYRAFLPLVKWRDRKERLTQPFEVTLGKTNQVIFVDEDWSVEGTDPKLTERVIQFNEMANYPKTDTVFFYVDKESKVSEIQKCLGLLPKSVLNHYVYCE